MGEFQIRAAFRVGWVVIASDGSSHARRSPTRGREWSEIYARGDRSAVVLGSWRNTMREAVELRTELRWLRAPSGLSLPVGLQAAQLAVSADTLTAWGSQAAEAGRQWVHMPTPAGRIRPTDAQAAAMWADRWLLGGVSVGGAGREMHASIAEAFLLGIEEQERQRKWLEEK